MSEFICKYLLDTTWRLQCLGCNGYDKYCDDYESINPDHQWYIDIIKKEAIESRKKQVDYED